MDLYSKNYAHTPGTEYRISYQPEAPGWPADAHMCSVWPNTVATLIKVREGLFTDNDPPIHYEYTRQVGMFDVKGHGYVEYLLPTLWDSPIGVPLIYTDPDHTSAGYSMGRGKSLAIVCELIAPCAPYPAFAAKVLWQPKWAEYPKLFTAFREPEQFGGGCGYSAFNEWLQADNSDYVKIPTNIIRRYSNATDS